MRTFPGEGRGGLATSRALPVVGELGESTASRATWRRKGAGNVDADDARRFLRQALGAERELHALLESDHRDSDHDGLFEWGGKRGARVGARLAGAADLGPAFRKPTTPPAPSLVEAVDLNSMLVREMRALAATLRRSWGKCLRRALGGSGPTPWPHGINATMWDPGQRFYYSVDRATNGFTVKTASGATAIDLRRKEIIGFLPLWAERGAARPRAGARASTPRTWRGVLAALRRAGTRRGRSRLRAADHALLPVERGQSGWNGTTLCLRSASAAIRLSPGGRGDWASG